MNDTSRRAETPDSRPSGEETAQHTRLDEEDEQAQALGYTHTAQSVDPGAYPRYVPQG